MMNGAEQKQGASTPAQVRALFIKSAVYQRRNTATNVCLVVAPVFFCVLLAVLQILANKLLLSQRQYKCGCQCTECCVPLRVQRNWTDAELERIANGEQLTPRFVRVERCTRLDTGYCERTRNATCRAYDDSNCSLRFSSPRQAVFCAIQQPSSWPPVMQTPRLNVRAGGSTTQWLPFTGSNMTAARLMADNLVDEPELPSLQPIIDLLLSSPLSLLSLRPSDVAALVLPMLSSEGLVQGGGESVDAAQLSRLALTFGSALWSNNDYYLENAFINTNSNTSRLQMVVPPGRCAAAGLGNVSNYVTLPLEEMLLRYYNASFPLVIPPLLRLFNITSSQIAGGLSDSQFGGITAACVDTLARELANATALERRLYCGFGVARCDSTYFTREYGGAWDFKELGPTTLKYDAYYNLSLPSDNTPTNYRIHALLNMATKAWTRVYWADLPITYSVRNRLLGVMSFPKYILELKLDFSILLGPLFYTWVVQMLMPSFLQQLVYEKEKRLRMMMKMHGLSDVSYWLVTYVWFLMLYVIYMIFFVFFGTVIRLKIFTTNSYTLQAVLYFIFGNNMIAFLFMISSLFSSSRTATVVAFLYIFAAGLIGELLLRTLMQQNRPYIVAVQLIPGFALYRGLFEFSEYSLRAIFSSNLPGLRWADLTDPGNGMIAVWVILVVEWPIFMVLAWYFEQILNNGSGARRHPLFFLQRLWRQDGADLKALQAARPIQGFSLPPDGAGDAPPGKGASEVEPPAVAEPMRAGRAGAAVSGNGRTVTGTAAGDADAGAAPAQRTVVSGPVGEGIEREGGGHGDEGRGVTRDGVTDAEGEGGGSGRLDASGRLEGDGERGDAATAGPTAAAAETAAADSSDGETDVVPLPGRPLETSASSRSRSSSKESSRSIGSAQRSTGGGRCSAGSGSGPSGGGGVEGCDGGEKAVGDRGCGAAEDLVVSAAVNAAAEAPPRRLLSGSSGGGGGGREFAPVAGAAAVPRGGSPRGGSPRGGSPLGRAGLPVSVAWPAAAASTARGQAASGGGACAAVASGGSSVASGDTGGVHSPGGGAINARVVIGTGSEAVRSSGPGKAAGEAAAAAAAAPPPGPAEDEERALSVGGGGGVATGGVPADPSPSGTASSDSSATSVQDAVQLLVQATDVAAEAARVEAMDEQELASTPIVVRNLAKVFFTHRGAQPKSGGVGYGRSCLGCCRTQRPYIAVRTLTLAIERGECFGLLGPNGAGKTTTIHMLTGFLEPSAGDALVEGRSVRTRMSEIYRMTGVCPQDNLLWDTLTGEEHLFFYGRLKGLKGKALTAAVEASIKSVKLHVNNAGKRRVSSYSGGMKRRLSVAISFIGDPQVVYLDEPSTGLDPASRRALWDVVREHKQGRAIILTTHSMEEAEILCDRLGIFVDGQLVCVGAPREITARYAGYLVFTLTVGPGHEDAAKAFVQRISPRARLTYTLGSTFKYELPTADVSLAGVFGAMEAAKAQMQVLDWGVANATLEEVFIKFARQIGVETRDQ